MREYVWNFDMLERNVIYFSPFINSWMDFSRSSDNACTFSCLLGFFVSVVLFFIKLIPPWMFSFNMLYFWRNEIFLRKNMLILKTVMFSLITLTRVLIRLQR